MVSGFYGSRENTAHARAAFPNAEVTARTTAKIGMIGALKLIRVRQLPAERQTAWLRAGRQSCFGLDVISALEKPKPGGN